MAVSLPFMVYFVVPDLIEDRLGKVMWADTGLGGKREGAAKRAGVALVQFHPSACPQGECHWQRTQPNPTFYLSKTNSCPPVYIEKKLHNNLYLGWELIRFCKITQELQI